MVSSWRPVVAPDLHRILRHGEVAACELIPSGSNYTFCVRLALEDREETGVYKPRRGERPLWDFPSGTLYRREYAAFLVSQAMGWDFIPTTLVRQGPYGVGSVQRFVVAEPVRAIRELQDLTNLDLARIATFDFVTNNADRKAGHLLRDATGKIWGIDQGLCFNVDPKVRTILLHWCGAAVPVPVAAELRSFRTSESRFRGLLQALETLLDADEVSAFVHRVDWVLEQRVFPSLDPYSSVPWPPF